MARDTETRRAMRHAARHEQPRLDQPRDIHRTRSLRPKIDSEKFGQASENLARYFGTARYLVIQTAFVFVWIVLNILQFTREIHWDPYPFILLNLAFSTQAAYAAPLILLAQNRQDDRDRANIDRDREVAARAQADTEFLARELSAVRLALADVVTTQDLDDSLSRLAKLIAGQWPPPDRLPVARRHDRLPAGPRSGPPALRVASGRILMLTRLRPGMGRVFHNRRTIP